MPNWEKAVMTSMSMNAPPPEELTEPSQSSNNKAPTPSQAQLNAYIKQLSKTSTTKFPPITDALPKEIDRPSFESVKDILPTVCHPMKMWKDSSLVVSMSAGSKVIQQFRQQFRQYRLETSRGVTRNLFATRGVAFLLPVIIKSMTHTQCKHVLVFIIQYKQISCQLKHDP